MSKPHPTQTGLSRRTALAGVLALAGSATPALAAYATPDDAELLRVVQAGLEADTAFCQLSEAWSHTVDMARRVFSWRAGAKPCCASNRCTAGAVV